MSASDLASREERPAHVWTVPDNMGAIIGQQLHLTVAPHEWWKEAFESLGYVVQWEEKQDVASMFLITTRIG